jgi:hypothetical protein
VGHSLLKRTRKCACAYERDLGVWGVSAACGSEAEELVGGDCDGGMFKDGGTRRREAVGGVGYTAAPGENKLINWKVKYNKVAYFKSSYTYGVGTKAQG